MEKKILEIPLNGDIPEALAEAFKNTADASGAKMKRAIAAAARGSPLGHVVLNRCRCNVIGGFYSQARDKISDGPEFVFDMGFAPGQRFGALEQLDQRL